MDGCPQRLRDTRKSPRPSLSRPLGPGSRRIGFARAGAAGERFLMNPLPRLSPLTRGRLCILLGACLWSLGGAFSKVLTKPTPLGLNEPTVHSLQIACFRVLFAGLVLVPAIRPRQFSFRPFMVVMVLSFALMNASYITAQALGTAANAVLLQYTAPLWLYVASVWWLHETPDRRNLVALFAAGFGVALILLGGWQEAQLGIVALGLF